MSDHAAHVCRRDTTYISHHELTRVARQIYCWGKVELHSTFTFVTLVCIQRLSFTGMNVVIECSGNIYPRFEVVVYPHNTLREWDVFIKWMETCLNSNDESHVREMKVDHKKTNTFDRAKTTFFSTWDDAKTTIYRICFFNAILLLKHNLIASIVLKYYHSKSILNVAIIRT